MNIIFSFYKVLSARYHYILHTAPLKGQRQIWVVVLFRLSFSCHVMLFYVRWQLFSLMVCVPFWLIQQTIAYITTFCSCFSSLICSSGTMLATPTLFFIAVASLHCSYQCAPTHFRCTQSHFVLEQGGTGPTGRKCAQNYKHLPLPVCACPNTTFFLLTWCVTFTESIS